MEFKKIIKGSRAERESREQANYEIKKKKKVSES